MSRLKETAVSFYHITLPEQVSYDSSEPASRLSLILQHNQDSFGSENVCMYY